MHKVLLHMQVQWLSQSKTFVQFDLWAEQAACLVEHHFYEWKNDKLVI